VEIPEAHECPNFNSTVSPIELLAALGRERFEAARDSLGDPLVASVEAVSGVLADEYARLLIRHRELPSIAKRRMEGIDGWVTPTRQKMPMPLSEISTREDRMRMERLMLRNTRRANTFGICASSSPIQHFGAPLPVGLQVFCPAFEEERLLAIGQA
jgi:aspartyl-tRNA(Asn)/glutamyl-tRNA(Gln) amidotransferase subunit A